MADPASTFVSSDADLLNLLRGRQQMTVNEMADAMEVTATAVRQRLTRLLGQGLIQRNAERAGRGRPLHQYELTEAGRRKSGANFADLAIVLWEELRSVKEPSVRRGLLERISQRLAIEYSHEIPPGTLEEKMTAMVGL
ncbi:MAG: MarR family transcriptional regulator, partial [Pirellulaceae bacterium]|nr:MarR family transcriptional regulator [Pirellulaceae bacterium]